MDLHKRKGAINTSLRMLKIVYKLQLNIISIPVIKLMVNDFLILCINIKCYLYCHKPFDPPLAATEGRQKCMM